MFETVFINVAVVFFMFLDLEFKCKMRLQFGSSLQATLIPGRRGPFQVFSVGPKVHKKCWSGA